MGIFSRSTEVLVGTSYFAEKMASIKKAFKEAHETIKWLIYNGVKYIVE